MSAREYSLFSLYHSFITKKELIPATKKISYKQEVADKYFSLLDQHLDELINGQATEMMELQDI
ncbi:MAG: hypothetical protein J7578_24400, partial [Chitinophagaceae bacterium]|nr:hypothetical protein [Chitinophagaceae bacterium]